MSFALHHVTPQMREYTQRYPNVTVQREAANRSVDIIDNNIDIAIRTREVEPDSNITIRRLAQPRRILTASPRYIAQHGIPKNPCRAASSQVVDVQPRQQPQRAAFYPG